MYTSCISIYYYITKHLTLDTVVKIIEVYCFWKSDYDIQKNTPKCFTLLQTTYCMCPCPDWYDNDTYYNYNYKLQLQKYCILSCYHVFWKIKEEERLHTPIITWYWLASDIKTKATTKTSRYQSHFHEGLLRLETNWEDGI